MCMEPKKELGHICNRFPIGAKSFPNIRNNICTKFPFYFPSYPPLFPTKFLGILAACFGIYLGWVSCTNLSWFEGRQPHSKIFSQSPKHSSTMEEIGEKVSVNDEAILFSVVCCGDIVGIFVDNRNVQVCICLYG